MNNITKAYQLRIISRLIGLFYFQNDIIKIIGGEYMNTIMSRQLNEYIQKDTMKKNEVIIIYDAPKRRN